MLDREDHRTRRCPRLGHEVDFHYCRTQEGFTICPKILDCWWETFDVAAFLKQNLPPEQWEALQNPKPPDKVAGLLELIRRARETAARSGGEDNGASPDAPPARTPE